MPHGVGATTLQTIPVGSFQTNPGLFFTETVRDQQRIEKRAVSPGLVWDTPLPQVGVVQKLRTVVEGTITVTPGGATPSQRWPRGILKQFKLSANGMNDLHNYDGIDAHVMRTVRYPAYIEKLDTFPGSGGEGGGPNGSLIADVAAGTYAFHQTFEHQVAADDTTLGAALFCQSSAANINIHRELATAADLFSANSSRVSMSLTCHTTVVRYEIPLAADGTMILPDLTGLRAVNSTADTQYGATGDVRVPLQRLPGQLHRLYATWYSTPTQRLTPATYADSSKRINSLRLEYGGNKRPLDYTPISELVAQENNYYGGIPPYDAMVIDFVRENPLRDVMIPTGVTELAIVANVDSGVTVSGGLVHVVQETLFQAA